MNGAKKACLKVAELLHEEYGIPCEEAKSISTTFLTLFRKQPEHPQMTLDDWRETLWRQALGTKYGDAAELVTRQWTELRYENLQPDLGVLSMLRSLKKKYSLALITNGASRSQWEKIHRLEMQEYFQSIVVSGDLGWEKPSKAIFEVALEQLNVQPWQCLMVGDRLETDILGAVNAELGGSVWVPLAETTEEGVGVTPDAIIQHVTMLPALLVPVKLDLGQYLSLSEPESDNSNCSVAS